MGAEIRIYEKYNVYKLADFSYTWDSARSIFLIPASLTLRAGIATGGDTTALNVMSTLEPIKTDVVFTAILPRNYRYNTVIDGVLFGNLKAQLRSMTGYDGQPQSNTVYMTITARLKSITAAGVSTTHKTYTIVTNWSCVNNGTYPSTVTCNKEFPFWIDLDNIFILATDKLLWELTFSGSHTNDTGSPGGDGTVYHAISTDEMFIELPYVP